MGYTTDFRGDLNITPALTEEQSKYLNAFKSTRRMKRDVSKLVELYGTKHGLNGSYGIDGEFFARDDGDYGQTRDGSILEYNHAPGTQPGLWCQWEVQDLNKLEWDGGEKFYNYVEWLQYLITKFFAPWGRVLNGTIEWRGEDWDDTGAIEVTDNIIKIHSE